MNDLLFSHIWQCPCLNAQIPAFQRFAAAWSALIAPGHVCGLPITHMAFLRVLLILLLVSDTAAYLKLLPIPCFWKKSSGKYRSRKAIHLTSYKYSAINKAFLLSLPRLRYYTRVYQLYFKKIGNINVTYITNTTKICYTRGEITIIQVDRSKRVLEYFILLNDLELSNYHRHKWL